MKIVLAYGGMERSKHALEKTAELAENRGADVTILSVVPELEPGLQSLEATAS
jgi:nucleotide-binding universal stress UspA family protein